MKYKHSESQIISAVKNSLSIAQVCRILNIKPCGGNYKTLKQKFKLWKIDISHFTGAAWNQGEKFINFSKKIPLREILVKNSTYGSTTHLKHRLFKEGYKKEICEKCGIVKWNNKKISFELDHVNGINNDNRIENLRILCPNCHSQTPTFRGRNKRKEKKYRKKYFCIDCGERCSNKNGRCNKCNLIKRKANKKLKEIFCPQCGREYSGQGNMCRKCYNEKNRIVIRPPYQQLLQEIKESSYVAVGRKYGVSDNAIRKWIRSYEKEI